MSDRNISTIQQMNSVKEAVLPVDPEISRTVRENVTRKNRLTRKCFTG